MSMDKHPSPFWQAVESVEGLSAVQAEWRHVLATDWTWAKVLLRPTGEVAAWYPRLDERYDDPTWPTRGYDVVCHDEDGDDYVGVCPDGSDNIKLTRAQLAVYALDLETLARWIAAALTLIPDVAEMDGPCRTCRVGTVSGPGQRAVVVYMLIATTPSILHAAVADLCLRHTQPLLVLTPTTRFWPAWPDVFVQRGGMAIGMSEAFSLMTGGLKANPDVLTALQRIVRGSGIDREEQLPIFRRRNDGCWELGFAGTRIEARDSKGLRYIAFLLAHPDESVHVTEAMAAAGNHAVVALAGEIAIDAEGWRKVRERQHELRQEIEDARRRADLTARQVAEAELARLADQARRARGKHGRDRKIGDASEKWRKAVRNAIDGALSRIQKRHEKLWRHLDSSIDLGTFLKYAPPPPAPAWLL
jgi:hypothetical protein